MVDLADITKRFQACLFARVVNWQRKNNNVSVFVCFFTHNWLTYNKFSRHNFCPKKTPNVPINVHNYYGGMKEVVRIVKIQLLWTFQITRRMLALVQLFGLSQLF